MMAQFPWKVTEFRKEKVNRTATGKGSSGGECAGRGRGKANKSKGKGKTKGNSKGKKGGSNKREAKGKKGGIQRSHMASVQIAMNMVAGVEIAQIWPSRWQDPIPPSTLASSAIQPAATASSSTVARRIFQLGSAPSNPSLLIFLVTSHLRMVLVHDLEHEWTTVAQEPGEEE